MKLKSLLITIILVGIVWIYLLFSKEVSSSVVSSLERCLTSVIPSLFGFMVLSDMLVSSGAGEYIARPFSLFARYFFRIKTEIFSIFLISLVGGYPVGAILLMKLLSMKKISVDEAEKSLCFCYCASPAFVLGIAGKIYSHEIAVIIFVSSALSNLIIAVAMGLFRPLPKKNTVKHEVKLSAKMLTSAIETTGVNLLKMCAVIIFFGTAITAVECLGITSELSENARIVLLSFFEISKISSHFDGKIIYFPISAALFSFGGVSVLLQLHTLIGNRLNTAKFLLSRLAAGVISYALCSLATHFLDLSVAVSLSSDSAVENNIRHISPIPSLFLIIMTILLLNKKNCCQFE